jgi:hypothetical protein
MGFLRRKSLFASLQVLRILPNLITYVVLTMHYMDYNMLLKRCMLVLVLFLVVLVLLLLIRLSSA